MVEMTQWITCSGTIEILSETYSGFALKSPQRPWKMDEEDIAAFAKQCRLKVHRRKLWEYLFKDANWYRHCTITADGCNG